MKTPEEIARESELEKALFDGDMFRSTPVVGIVHPTTTMTIVDPEAPRHDPTSELEHLSPIRPPKPANPSLIQRIGWNFLSAVLQQLAVAIAKKIIMKYDRRDKPEDC